jgi:hypothetical protein
MQPKHLSLKIRTELNNIIVHQPIETHDKLVFPYLTDHSLYSDLSAQTELLNKVPQQAVEEVLEKCGEIIRQRPSHKLQTNIIQKLSACLPFMCLINIPIPFFIVAFTQSGTLTLPEGLIIWASILLL